MKKYINKGDRVLEIGPGPGRFTIELAKLGTKIGIVDISENQLQLNKMKIKEAVFEESVEWWKKCDIINLEGIPDDTFDLIVCYGKPLSYIFEFVDQALEEILRVTKAGGIIITSVMSCIGTYHHLINNVFIDQEIPLEKFDELTRTGDVLGNLANRGTHQCHMLRYGEFEEILSKYPIKILDAAASNILSSGMANE
ncbi:MAG: methyltransferase domain-containing protein [Candidatus Thorarchaeota archaeon]